MTGLLLYYFAFNELRVANVSQRRLEQGKWNKKMRKQTDFCDLCACVFSLSGVVEVYRVTRRVELGIKATAVCSEKLQQLLKDISRVWNNLMGFMSLAKLAVRPLNHVKK